MVMSRVDRERLESLNKEAAYFKIEPFWGIVHEMLEIIDDPLLFDLVGGSYVVKAAEQNKKRKGAKQNATNKSCIQ